MMVEILVGMLVGMPVGAYIWGMCGERIMDWIEERYDK